MRSTSLSAILMAGLALICLSGRAYCGTFGSGANTFTIDFVDIGNPGNPADVTGMPNPAGAVSYGYKIAKYEVSEDMIAKANAEGGLALTKDNRGADKAATSITWNEAARFVNWLNTSKGFAPAYKFAIKPGDATYAANVNNQIQLWTAGDPGYNAANPYRNSLAFYFLPSVDEWYKAAFYDPAAGVYYDYATGSNTAPTPVRFGTDPGTAVYGQPLGGYPDQTPPYVPPASIYEAGGLSPYGTMAQDGNAMEWEETDLNLVNGPVTDQRGIRKSYWSSGVDAADLLATSRFAIPPANQINTLGFRVAAVPEPGTMSLLALSALVSLGCRKGRRS